MTDSPVWPRELLTLEEWRSLPAETHRSCELVEGTLLVNASPVARHQRLVLQITRRLEGILPDDAEVFIEFELLCDPGPPPTVRQPDVSVVRAGVPDHAGQLLPADVLGVIEVLSPGTRRTDRVAKVYDYAEAGIGWYLIVDPEPRTLTLFTLPAGGCPYDCVARDVTAVDLPGIGSLDLSD